jgi:hypothetical protein
MAHKRQIQTIHDRFYSVVPNGSRSGAIMKIDGSNAMA